MILIAFADAARENVQQRALDALVVLHGAWTIVEAFIFDGKDVKWWSSASAAALTGSARSA
jgi:hypothetical protein